MNDINPRTGKRWRIGDVRDDGKIFKQFKTSGAPSFASEVAYHRHRISLALTHCRQRAKAAGIECSLDVDYLVSIYPVDHKCPVFGTTMTWGDKTSRDHSPSLDRIDPKRGYVRGNVAWISMEANRIKQNASLEVLKRLVAYVESAQAKE